MSFTFKGKNKQLFFWRSQILVILSCSLPQVSLGIGFYKY